MAREFSGTAQYLTFADVAGMDLPSPTLSWTVAALVYTDSVAAGNRHIVSHGDVGAAACGWRFFINGAHLSFTAVAQWGQNGTATTDLTTGTWYGISASKASSGTNITYKRYSLNTQTFASEAVDTFANGYTDGASAGRIGAVVSSATTIELWDGRIKRVAYWNGATLSESELAQFFNGDSVDPGGSLKSRWDVDGLADPEVDEGPNAADATNVSTTFVADPLGDIAISGLTAVASVAGANEFVVNEAGTEKKASATQIAAFVSPAASDTVAGVLELAVQSEQETGTDVVRAVTPGRQKYHPSAAKFWVKWTGGSTTITASYNIDSIAATATGDADGTITTDFSGVDWFGKVSTLTAANGWDAQECQGAGFNAHAAGTFGVLCSTITDGNTAACSLTNPDSWHVVGFGDQ